MTIPISTLTGCKNIYMRQRTKKPTIEHAISKDSDQHTGGSVFAGHTGLIVGFVLHWLIYFFYFSFYLEHCSM